MFMVDVDSGLGGLTRARLALKFDGIFAVWSA